jgi:translation initiation factor IF-2
MANDRIRISKILKEFNIGISTLVEFLKKKGVEVEANPNGKVSEDVYTLVKAEFGNEHALKVASKKISWKPASGSISVSDIEKRKDDDEPEDEKEFFIKSNTVDIVIDDLPGPKIIGKLSDEQLSRKLYRKTETQSSAKRTESPKQTRDTVKSVKPAEKVEEHPSTEHVESKKSETVITAKQRAEELTVPKIVKKIDIDNAGKPQKQDDKKREEDRRREKDRPKDKNNQKDNRPQKDNTNQKDKKKFDKKSEPVKQFQPQVDKHAAQDRPVVQDRPAAQDKPAIQDKPTAQDKPAVQEKLVIQDKAIQTIGDLTGMEPRVEPEFIKTKVEQLSGPNVVGKIDLTQFKKPSESNKDKNKRKRKRIKKDTKVNVAAEINARREHRDKPNNNNNNNNNIGNRDRNRNNNINNNNNRSNNNTNVNNANVGDNNKNRFKPIRRQVDDEAVQRQVKDTLARLTAGKGKTKSSKYRREKRDAVSQKAMEERELQKIASNILKVTEFVSVNELATMMDIPVVKVIGACMNLGLMVSINQRLDAEALVLVAEEFGYSVEFVTAELQDSIEEDIDKDEDLVPRPPIITVMGHVDHGKTSLLDNIRKTNVIAGEAGGITQHIGAYSVKLEDGRRITFLDTPGHEAFTAMRARGAKITDVAIIIVAADDAVMPQTVEAINHAVAAGVPMIFAVNKIDKPGASPDKIREQLANMNYLVEEWGGKYQSQEIAAKQGTNVDKLLEKVLLEADLLELKANPNKKAIGTVIESSLDKGRGYVTTLLVQNGTLRTGDVVLSGIYTGKVRAMFNERGKRLEEAGPATPVLILGLNGAPAAGETFNVMDDEREAREIANKREQLIRIQDIRTKKHITLEEIGRRIAIGSFKELNIVVKTDVDGSMEALADSLIKLSTEEVQVNIIHKAVGAISESDVLLAAASNAIIIGFQVRPSAGARKLAEKEEIEIRLYSVIYNAINEVRDGTEGMLAPELKEEITASVEVLETFKITKVGTVAGCIVREGKISRSSKIRIIRNGIVIYTGNLGSLKRFKDDAKEVISGYECGLNIENFNDIKVGDIVEAYEQIEVKRKL